MVWLALKNFNNKHMYKIFLDTETTGLPGKGKKWETDFNEFPHIVSIAWIVADEDGKEIDREYHIIKPDGWDIPEESVKIHGISSHNADSEGTDLKMVLKTLLHDTRKCELIVGHNLYFDLSIIKANMMRLKFNKERFCEVFHKDRRYCTMAKGMSILKLKKWPRLKEIYQELFNEEIKDAHSAIGDVVSTMKVYNRLTTNIDWEDEGKYYSR